MAFHAYGIQGTTCTKPLSETLCTVFLPEATRFMKRSISRRLHNIPASGHQQLSDAVAS